MKAIWILGAASLVLAACGGQDTSPATPGASTEPAPGPAAPAEPAVSALELHVLDCGTIAISNLDDFSSAGDYAGQTDTFTNTCWLVRHPEGDLLWDTGVPGMLADGPSFEQDIYTVSLAQTITGQLRERDIEPREIEYVSLSHSHFDHVGQMDQVSGATWLVSATEYAFMFPEDSEDGGEAATQFGALARMKIEQFTGEKDVFGDGTVIIFPIPGHTPGHTGLQVTLPQTGPVLLTGDLYHRTESRQLRRVPRFNTDEAATLASMDAFEARAQALGAKVIIQHEPTDIDPLAEVLR